MGHRHAQAAIDAPMDEAVLDVRLPETGAAVAPLLLDSPHSGRVYPPDFRFACSLFDLRHAEDSFVDWLIESAPDHGATLIAARFPRSYIDVNRAPDDIDAKLLVDAWSGRINASDKGKVGMGLVRRLCRPGVPLYQHRLRAADIAHRLDCYYEPYHAAVADRLQRLKARFGAVWLLDCHSMPSVGGGLPQVPDRQVDFVLGDRDGSTCDPMFRAVVGDVLRDLGYRVQINRPYRGVEMVRRYGRPKDGQHALQLEINRALYLDEARIVPHQGFDALRADLDRLIAHLAEYTRAAAAG